MAKSKDVVKQIKKANRRESVRLVDEIDVKSIASEHIAAARHFMAKSIRGKVYWNIAARDARSCNSTQSETSGKATSGIHRRLLSHSTITPGP